jgi:hypothetical protein
MINLAGNKDCDHYIIKELQEANILAQIQPKSNGEVATIVRGELNGFKFTRAWYYWVVTGYMPIKYAVQLYEDHKDLMIRVNGDCTNPSPEGNTVCRNLNNLVAPIVKRYLDIHDISYDEALQQIEAINKQGEQFIYGYHIDTQEGLNVFAEMISKHHIKGD